METAFNIVGYAFIAFAFGLPIFGILTCWALFAFAAYKGWGDENTTPNDVLTRISQDMVDKRAIQRRAQIRRIK